MQTGTDRSPPPPWNVDDVTGQCPRGGGCLCMSKSGGVFQIDAKGVWCACECPTVGEFFKLMTSRGQCPRGGCLGMSSPPPPSGNPVSAPGVPPIQVQTPPPPPPGWLATGLLAFICHCSRVGGGGGGDKLAIDKGGNLPEKVENH